MVRMLDALNQNDEVSVRIRCNGVTWWEGYVRFLSTGGRQVPAGANLVQMDVPAKGRAAVLTNAAIGMFRVCADQAKYMLLLTQSHGWVWHNTLVESSEDI